MTRDPTGLALLARDPRYSRGRLPGQSARVGLVMVHLSGMARKPTGLALLGLPGRPARVGLVMVHLSGMAREPTGSALLGRE